MNTPRFDTIIATVGKQPMPVLLPLLEYAPTQAYLIATDDVLPVAKIVRQAVQDTPQLSGMRVTVMETVSPYIAAETYDHCTHAIQQALAHDHRVVINISGGTTMMALGAQHAACDATVPMLYINTDDGEIIHLAAHGSEQSRASIASNVSGDLYAHAHGAVLNEKAPWGTGLARQEPFVSVARLIGQQGVRSVPLMDAIRSNLNQKVMTLPDLDDTAQTIITTLVEAQILERLPVKGNTAAFQIGATHQYAREFLEGHWLEVYVADACAQSGRFDEVRCGVLLIRTDDKRVVENELDVLVASRGRLAVVSCKTGKNVYEKERSKEKKERQKLAVFELDTLLQADLMGLYARKLLVTNQPGFEDELFNRAYFSQTCCVVGGRLTQVAQIVEDHLRKPQLLI